MRKICVLTGTRAEYGLIKPLLKEIKSCPQLKLYLIVTGMHLLKGFGLTERIILKDGFKIYARLKIFKEKQTPLDMSLALGKAIVSFAKILHCLKPDILLLVADRIEMLAAALASLALGIPIFHLCGGERSGSIDESIRHALTKIAHIHLANTKVSKERILKMGEEPWRVYNVGTLGVSHRELKRLPTREQIAARFNLDSKKPLFILLQHPVVEEARQAGSQMRSTLEAIKRLKEQTLIIYPNNDPGAEEIIKVIQEYAGLPFIRIAKNLERETFLGLLKIASLMMGNSSAGIIEAPFFGLPVINVGSRQDLRERAENVFDVNYDTQEIIKAVRRIQKTGYKKIFKANPYKNINTEKKIVHILKNIILDDKLLRKRFTY